jgi:hypothetical protein
MKTHVLPLPRAGISKFCGGPTRTDVHGMKTCVGATGSGNLEILHGHVSTGARGIRTRNLLLDGKDIPKF